MERQLWRLQDLRDGGGFGYWVELFFLVTGQLLTIKLSPDTKTSLIVGMFRAITSNWRQHKNSFGTQRVILNLVCDMAIPYRGLTSNTIFPRYITDELLGLLENMVEGAGGQSGSHIDDAMKELEGVHDILREPGWTEIRLFKAEAARVISRSRVPVPTS